MPGAARLSFHFDGAAGLEFVFSSGRRQSLPEHTHTSTATVTLVRRGRVCLTMEGARESYRRGESYLILPDQVHQPDYDEDYDLVSICLDRKRLDSRELKRDCRVLMADLLARGLLSSDDVRKLASALDHLPPASERPPAPRPPAPLSRFHFIRRFKKDLGLTPHKYLMQKRLSRVKNLLRSSRSISQAAQEAGFYDQSHLDRCFKKAVGLTPREYQAACFPLSSGNPAKQGQAAQDDQAAQKGSPVRHLGDQQITHQK